MADYGLKCPEPECGEVDTWDRAHGDCYSCGRRGPRPTFLGKLARLFLEAFA